MREGQGLDATANAFGDDARRGHGCLCQQGHELITPGPGQELPAEPLSPPGLLGNIDDKTYHKLLDAVTVQHDSPPNPLGPSVAAVGRWWGPEQVPGQFRAKVGKTLLCRTYLEEGIFQLHVQGLEDPKTGKKRSLSLTETAEKLGYHYKHVVAVFRAMKRRAFEAEGESEVTGGVREFLNHHLEQAIEVASERMPHNAAYGAVLIRAVEAFKELNGLDSSEDRNLNIEELAERVRGRSPLLLEVVKHQAEADEKTDRAAVEEEGAA